jgi:hypothetical protein
LSNFGTAGSSFSLEGCVSHTDGAETPFEVVLVEDDDSWKLVDFAF